jgi:hypothetical protein
MPSLKISQLTQVVSDAETLGSELAGYLSGTNYKIPVSDFTNSCVLENMGGQLDLSTRTSNVLPIGNGGTNVTTSRDVLLSLFASAPNSSIIPDSSGTVGLRPDRRFLFIPFMKASFDVYYNNFVSVSAGTWSTYTAFTQDSTPGSMTETKTYIDSQLLFPAEATNITQAFFSIVCAAAGFTTFDFRVVTRNSAGLIEHTIVGPTPVTLTGGTQEYNIVATATWPPGFSTSPSLEFEINPANNGLIVMFEVDMYVMPRSF